MLKNNNTEIINRLQKEYQNKILFCEDRDFGFKPDFMNYLYYNKTYNRKKFLIYISHEIGHYQDYVDYFNSDQDLWSKTVKIKKFNFRRVLAEIRAWNNAKSIVKQIGSDFNSWILFYYLYFVRICGYLIGIITLNENNQI